MGGWAGRVARKVFELEWYIIGSLFFYFSYHHCDLFVQRIQDRHGENRH